MFEIALICVPTILVPVLFFFVVNTIRNSHKTDVLYHTDNVFFLSILAGLLALVVGLTHQKFVPASFTELFPHDAYILRGWPVAWLGQPSVFGLLFNPLCILINIVFVAVFAVICLGIYRLVNRSLRVPSGKINLDLLFVCIFAVFPFWGQFIPWVQFIGNYLDSIINTV